MVNDITIAAGIIVVFILLGGALPYINQSFGADSSSSPNTDGLISKSGNNIKVADDVTAANVLLSIFKMFFWTFGLVPWWLDLIVFIPMRIILAVVVARNVWIGGGG